MMSDRILLSAMRFEGHHGVTDEERAVAQPFEVDVELLVDLRAAGTADDLARTVDYGRAFGICREVVEATTCHLLEAIAERLAHDLLGAFPTVVEVIVRVRKLAVPLDGRLAYAGVQIHRAAVAPRPRAR